MSPERLGGPSPAPRAHVVILGGGFGGLACAQALGNTDIDVIVIDRRNHNLFQPLLYQVATAALSPADISEPIRRTLGRYRNIRVMLAEVSGIDTAARAVQISDGGRVAYEHLVIATGSEYNYFGNDGWRTWAPGLKTIHEARLIRQRLLLAFEKAELSDDPLQKRALLTTVVIGGGPTGVEMAGAVSELGRFMIARDFRSLDPADLRVVLIEAGPRLLSGFPENLSDYAADYLRGIGVELRTGAPVKDIGPHHVTVGQDRIETGCVVWGAGVKASPAAGWLGVEPGPGGRVAVGPDLALPSHPEIRVIGDTALAQDADGSPLPGLAQVARQQGFYVGKALRRKLLHNQDSPPFRFRNRGNTAVIGRNAAVFDFGTWQLRGRLAWMLWAIVHVWLLVNFEKRLLVSLQWIWRYTTRQRGARVIDESTPQVPATTQRSET
ncbi:NAD(P)/FAD-dependent oxidoreductase [Plastorhodobacter daqingensis]|uniref:NADH:ubiquinone reductase (non-electrogenic) n=1 Tax=Plastorhodobacter daqingensis TaxID=1387281 RepID=A0ABW2ULI5_9RHOB